jgi:DNA-binding MarR family transcriptional regulator
MTRRAFAVTDEEVVDLLRSTARVLDNRLESQLRSDHLRASGLIMLRAVVRSEVTLNVSAAARALGCSKQRASEIVARLVCAGLLEVSTSRDKPATSTRELHITAAGRVAVERADAKFAAWAEPIGEALTPRERKRLRKMLGKVRSAAQAKARGSSHRFSGAGDPSAWLDGYISDGGPAAAPPRQPRMFYGVPEDQWNAMPMAKRYLYVDADLFGLTPEQTERYVANPTEFLRNWSRKDEPEPPSAS